MPQGVRAGPAVCSAEFVTVAVFDTTPLGSPHWIKHLLNPNKVVVGPSRNRLHPASPSAERFTRQGPPRIDAHSATRSARRGKHEGGKRASYSRPEHGGCHRARCRTCQTGPTRWLGWRKSLGAFGSGMKKRESADWPRCESRSRRPALPVRRPATQRPAPATGYDIPLPRPGPGARHQLDRHRARRNQTGHFICRIRSRPNTRPPAPPIADRLFGITIVTDMHNTVLAGCSTIPSVLGQSSI